MYVVLDGSTGYKTIEDLASLCFSFFDECCFVLTNPQGNALYQGLPILSRLSLTKNGSFMVFSSINEFLENINPEKVYVLDKSKGQEEFPDSLGNKDAIVFPDNKTKETKFKTNKELIYFKGLGEDLTLSSEASIILYEIKKRL